MRLRAYVYWLVLYTDRKRSIVKHFVLNYPPMLGSHLSRKGRREKGPWPQSVYFFRGGNPLTTCFCRQRLKHLKRS